MKQKGALRTAEHHYRRKQYAQAISTLEPQIFLYRENAFFFHLLGLACLKTGDLGGARSYLMRATQINSDAIAPRLALAACDLGRSDTSEALQMWLEILDEDPDNRYALKGLSLLRNGLGREGGNAGDATEQMHKLYPDLRTRRVPVPSARIAILLAGVLILAGAVVFLSPHALSLVRQQEPERDGSEHTELTRRTGLVEQVAGNRDATPRYVLSDSELREVFDSLRRFFLNERDNLAAREVNRIINSNATQQLKDQALMLRNYLRPPTFADFSDNFALDDIRSDIVLHDGTYVRWRGRSSNVEISEEQVTFDFLVGYEDFVTVEAIVPVEFRRAVRLDPQLGIEIIGRVRRDATSPEGFRLEGGAIRLLQAAAR